MTTRDDAIEAGAQAVHGLFVARNGPLALSWEALPGDIRAEMMMGSAAVVDAVDPIFRADEREQVWAEAAFLVLTHRDMAPDPSNARGRLDRLLLDVASRHDAIAREDS